MTSALVGARTTAQLSDTLKNLQNLAFSAEVLAQVDSGI
jgi:L-glyceraldehyde 3-phosphate reductase